MTFDPNGVGLSNGNLFGFPYSEKESDIVIIPVPWDATASYSKGTSHGPKAILDASPQLDFYHPKLENAYLTKVHMTEISQDWHEINHHFNEQSEAYFKDLEDLGEQAASEKHAALIQDINTAHQSLSNHLKERAAAVLNQGKICAILGGEHSVPLGLLEALNGRESAFSILQIDAHADLRAAYEGFYQSHASIMYNAIERCENIRNLVQVGIRDVSEAEVNFAKSNPRIHTFYDWDLKSKEFEGLTWDKQCEDIISKLDQRVFISFDIDGLLPYLCPNTGTPVAGGFSLEQISHLIFKMVESGRTIIGFDLNEVAPGTEGDWDANVGARALWQLICATELSRRKDA